MQLGSVGETGIAGPVHPWGEAWGREQLCPPPTRSRQCFTAGKGPTLRMRGCCPSVVARAKILAAGLQGVGEGLFLLGGPPCNVLRFLPGQRLGGGEGAHH